MEGKFLIWKDCMGRLVQQVRFFVENTLPFQAFVGLSWFFAGACAVAFPVRWGWDAVVVCAAIILLRTIGMCWNRLFDRTFDAENIRTCHRPIPSGRMSVYSLVIQTVVASLLFVFFLWMAPLLGKIVGGVTCIAVLVYTFLKRTTAVCHFFLGGIHGMIPIVGSLYQRGDIQLSVLALACAAMLSVAGTDIIYALQDCEVDARLQLKSLPVLIGPERSTIVACCLHFLSMSLLFIAFSLAQVHCVTYVVLIGALFLLTKMWIHFLQGRSDESRMFRFSLYLFSMTAFLGILLDRLWNM
jgi:4-hydroxybenzoate polyprenyltransferase